MNLKILAPIIVVSVILVVLSISFQDESAEITITSPTSSVIFESVLTLMETNGVKHLIPLDKIKGGGPPKDGITSIDNPVFADIQNSNFMSDSDVVIGLEINGKSKAYPLFILVWHEIVNDKVGELQYLSLTVLCVIQIRYLRELLMDKKWNLELQENYTTVIC